MALWWLCISSRVKPENLTFYGIFDLEGHGQLPHKTTGILTKVFRTSGPNLVILAWMGGELWRGQAQNGVNLDFQVKIWPWRSRSISPQNNRDLNQGPLHLWSKFGDPSLNGSRVIARTRKWLTHRQTNTHTDAGNDNTRKPKLASGNKTYEC